MAIRTCHRHTARNIRGMFLHRREAPSHAACEGTSPRPGRYKGSTLAYDVELIRCRPISCLSCLSCLHHSQTMPTGDMRYEGCAVTTVYITEARNPRYQRPRVTAGFGGFGRRLVRFTRCNHTKGPKAVGQSGGLPVVFHLCLTPALRCPHPLQPQTGPQLTLSMPPTVDHDNW